MAEITLDAGASFEQDLPASYNGFVFVISGSAEIGEDAVPLSTDQVGWLDRPAGEGPSSLRFIAGPKGARLVMYAGQPQGDPIVSHGPFIGDSKQDIVRLYDEYRAGRFERLSELARAANTS